MKSGILVTRQLLIASGNSKKLKEMQDLLTGLPFDALSLKSFPDVKEVPEDGKTFEENAAAKALGYAQATGLLTLAEDSGLCCEALDHAPGIYSARFSGLDKNDHENNLKVLRLLEKIPDNCRGAYFKSAVALAEPGRLVGVVSGEVHGYIAREIRGTNGFGYDVIFYYPPFQKTFGEVPAEMKYKVSHRFKALEKAKVLLETQLPPRHLRSTFRHPRESGDLGV